MESPRTVRGYVARDGRVLLQPGPARPPWLADVLAEFAGCEVLITVTCVGQQPPDWVPAALAAVERPAWVVRVAGARARALGSG